MAVNLTLRAKWDKLSDALHSYANDQAEDFVGPDWHNANEYSAEGYAIGEEAFALPDDDNDREDHVEAAIKSFPESARYLIAVAADYRMAELAKAPADRKAA